MPLNALLKRLEAAPSRTGPHDVSRTCCVFMSGRAVSARLSAPLPIWPVLTATTTTQSLTTLAALALTAVAPRAAPEVGIGPALIGYQVSLVYFGAMLTSLIGGGLVRRLGAARTSQLALWVTAAGCLLSAVGTLPTLALGAVVIGLGYGCTNPAASQQLARTPTGARMNLIFSVKQCGVPIGGVMAGLLVPSITVLLSWQAALAICAAMTVALSLAINNVRPVWDVDRDPSATVGWPLGLIAAATSLFGFCAIGWNGVYMAAVARQSPPGSIGIATGGSLSITYAGIIVGPSAFAALHDQLGLSYGDGIALLALLTALGVACLFRARRVVDR